MEIQTAHFGTVEIDENRIIAFENGLPGLENYKKFALLSDKETKPICWLQSLECKEVSLPVMDPFIVFPNYSFDIADDDIKTLHIEQVKDIYVLSVLVIPKPESNMTINLAAPIIINVRNSKARQIILDDKRYRVRVPISELLNHAAKDGI